MAGPPPCMLTDNDTLSRAPPKSVPRSLQDRVGVGCECIQVQILVWGGDRQWGFQVGMPLYTCYTETHGELQGRGEGINGAAPELRGVPGWPFCGSAPRGQEEGLGPGNLSRIVYITFTSPKFF